MTPIQQLMLGVGASKKTYMDDVFSTQLYLGNATARNVNNGIDLSSEGGLVWFKSRDDGLDHYLFDTVRGKNSYLSSNTNAAAGVVTSGDSNYNNMITSFNNNGLSLGTSNVSNASGDKMSNWSFRKAKGFCDVVTYSGQNSAQNISHSLGCVPGMIIVKKTSGSDAWAVWHRSLPNTSRSWLRLNTTDDQEEDSTIWGDTPPTASVFTVGYNGIVNESGGTYVAYLFAGGESTDATAQSVTLDSSGDYLTSNTNANLSMGTGDYTVEGWFRLRGSSFSTATGSEGCGLFMNSPGSGGLDTDYGGHIFAYHWPNSGLTVGTAGAIGITPPKDQWFHLALTRSGTTVRAFYNGILKKTATNSTDHTGQNWAIGGYFSNTYLMEGDVSNFRVVKGTAVYTSSFRPPTKPLTSISGTSLLCCNGSTVTSATTGSVTSSGDPAASTDSPFDDPAGFVFGDSKEGIIKCGSYVGTGSAGLEVNVGFEPQWLIMKTTTSSTSENWFIFDSMRGQSTGLSDPAFYANTNGAEGVVNRIDLTPTGFKMTDGAADLNGTDRHFIYMAIRRPDGYVGKPAEVGTDVFTVVAGTSAANGNPTYISNGVRDFGVFRQPATTENWNSFSRLTQGTNIFLNGTNVEAALSVHQADFNNGMVDATASDVANYQGWLWKRHAGFDVVTYTGGGAGTVVPHSLNAVPEMIWVKCRSGAHDWAVYHKGLNGGTNPEQDYLTLNSTDAEADNANRWNDTAPSASHFTVGGANSVGDGSATYLAMLFTSVNGISKCGYYTGNGSTQTISGLGFSPRFIIIKRTDSAANWLVFDTTRGWGSGNDPYLLLDSNAAQDGNYNMGSAESDGFSLINDTNTNASSGKYIYYAHA